MIRQRTRAEKAARKKKQNERAAFRAQMLTIGQSETTYTHNKGMISFVPHGDVPRIPWDGGTVQTKKPHRAIEKRGAARSKTLLEWIRRQSCELPRTENHPHCHGRMDPHHFPTTGSNGVQIDPLCMSACRSAHDLCHWGHFSREQQEAAAHRTAMKFWRDAPRETKRDVLTELLESLA